MIHLSYSYWVIQNKAHYLHDYASKYLIKLPKKKYLLSYQNLMLWSLKDYLHKLSRLFVNQW